MIRNILHSGQVSVATQQKTNATDAIDPKHKTTPAMQQTHRCYVWINLLFRFILFHSLDVLVASVCTMQTITCLQARISVKLWRLLINVSVKNLHKLAHNGVLSVALTSFANHAYFIIHSLSHPGFPVLGRALTRSQHNDGWFLDMNIWIHMRDANMNGNSWFRKPCTFNSLSNIWWKTRSRSIQTKQIVFRKNGEITFSCWGRQAPHGRLLQHRLPRGGHAWKPFSVVYQVSLL